MNESTNESITTSELAFIQYLDVWGWTDHISLNNTYKQSIAF